MHMADALLAPAVAATMYAASTATAGVSVFQLKREFSLGQEDNLKKVPTMAVMASLVFAGQMINYTIPGTGSSGHICGGVMLSALLGPWAGFLSMIAVLLIQCLFFADGGLMALGANIWNMAFYGCILGYFLLFRPIIRGKILGKINARMRIIIASIACCIITLQLGAFSVVLETGASGITDLPFAAFVALMQPIHLAIGLIEGLVTAAILVFVYENRPEMIIGLNDEKEGRTSFKTTLVILGIVACVTGGLFSQFASGNPDGLEWSLFGNEEAGYEANMGLNEEEYGITSQAAQTAAEIQTKTAFLPDYAFAKDEENKLGTTVSGLVGSIMVAMLAAAICFVGRIFRTKKHA